MNIPKAGVLAMRSLVRMLATLTVLLSLAGVARADWPDRPINFMVPFGPGGTTDTIARALGTELSKKLGQPIIIQNRPGAQGTIYAGVLARSQPDGYTVGLLSSTVGLWTLVVDNPQTLRDFSVIGSVGRAQYGVVVSASSPYRTLRDLVAASAQKKGGINFGTPSPVNTVAMMQLAKKLGMRFEPINYKSAAEAVVALLGDQVDAVIQTPTDFMAHVKSGRLRVLASASAVRLRDLPDVPTLRELGYDLVVDVYVGVGAPAGLPEPIRGRLERDVLQIVADPAFQAQLRSFGFEPAPLPGDKFHEVIQASVDEVLQLKSQFRDLPNR